MAFDPHKPIISQYAASPTLVQLIDNMHAYIDPTADFDAFYTLVWDIRTAQGYGLDVWGRIVDVGRVVEVPSDEDTFGFQQMLPDSEPFNQGVFYAGTGATSNYALSDDAYRLLIYAKALANICDGSIPAINKVLRTLFPGRGNCYCTDGLNMTMTYHFSFALSAVELAIVQQSGVLANPAGIAYSIVTPP